MKTRLQYIPGMEINRLKCFGIISGSCCLSAGLVGVF